MLSPSMGSRHEFTLLHGSQQIEVFKERKGQSQKRIHQTMGCVIDVLSLGHHSFIEVMLMFLESWSCKLYAILYGTCLKDKLTFSFFSKSWTSYINLPDKI